jgi:predicted enzyme related to lactoylglutathione lyase
MENTAYTPGSFCTVVLHTRDIERAATFYNSVVGWTTHEVSGTPGHRFLQSNGKTVASLHHTDQPSDVWVPHVSVENIESTTTQAIDLGAQLVSATDIPGLARIATFRDPESAIFGLWQPAPQQGAEVMEEVGSIWWIEVLSNDVAGAKDFYGRLFGWNSVDTSFEPFALYSVFKRGDVQEGGILPIGHDWGIAPRWSPIFSVQDCDATIDHAKSLGASEIFVHTVPKAGRVGSIRDTGGAIFVMRGPVPSIFLPNG